MDLDLKAAELKREGVAYCLATVIKSEGSTPRQIGAKMIVTASASFGSVGGGALEHKVIDDARALMLRRISECKSYPLGPMLGQCCGGSMDVFIEPVLPPKSIYVFGAGHIAEALVPMLAELGYRVTLIDERPERMELAAFANVPEKWNELPSDIFKRIEFNGDTHVIVITHEHKHDEGIVHFCLDKPFKYLGCIGSRSKWEKFKARYRTQGFNDGQFARVSTPVGLDIGAESPFEIAVAIVAELIQLHAKADDFKKGVAHFKG